METGATVSEIKTEYKISKNSTDQAVPKSRISFFVYLLFFHVAFIILYGFFANYQLDPSKTKDDVPRLYSSKERDRDSFLPNQFSLYIIYKTILTILKCSWTFTAWCSLALAFWWPSWSATVSAASRLTFYWLPSFLNGLCSFEDGWPKAAPSRSVF